MKAANSKTPNAYSADCPTRQILDRVGDKWAVLILLLVRDERRRDFAEGVANGGFVCRGELFEDRAIRRELICRERVRCVKIPGQLGNVLGGDRVDLLEQLVQPLARLQEEEEGGERAELHRGGADAREVVRHAGDLAGDDADLRPQRLGRAGDAAGQAAPAVRHQHARDARRGALEVAASMCGRRPIGGFQNKKPATDFSVRALQLLR